MSEASNVAEEVTSAGDSLISSTFGRTSVPPLVLVVVLTSRKSCCFSDGFVY